MCRRPKRPCPLVVPAMMAAFLDENLPDGTRLRPGTKFIKYWKMRNTGTISWNTDTKVKNYRRFRESIRVNKNVCPVRPAFMFKAITNPR